MEASLYSDTKTAFSVSPQDPSQQNFVILPGIPVQPAYLDVNPYSGHHNNNVVPVVYNPYDYGVAYDQPQALMFQAPAITPNQFYPSQVPKENINRSCSLLQHE